MANFKSNAQGPVRPVRSSTVRRTSCESVLSLLTREGSARHQMYVLNQFHQYIKHEVVPAIRTDCRSPDMGRKNPSVSGDPSPTGWIPFSC